jgi:hypothetical protein
MFNNLKSEKYLLQANESTKRQLLLIKSHEVVNKWLESIKGGGSNKDMDNDKKSEIFTEEESSEKIESDIEVEENQLAEDPQHQEDRK